MQKMREVALRIREMREITGLTRAEMAQKFEVTPEEYDAYESGSVDFPFTFIHKCALVFGLGITDLL
jgi:acetyl-CoA synthetase